jgi:hypothetical protein
MKIKIQIESDGKYYAAECAPEEVVTDQAPSAVAQAVEPPRDFSDHFAILAEPPAVEPLAMADPPPVEPPPLPAAPPPPPVESQSAKEWDGIT